MILKDFYTVEFHCHTYASKDSLTKIHDLVAIAHKRGLDRLVITDHNTISGALKARDRSRAGDRGGGDHDDQG